MTTSAFSTSVFSPSPPFDIETELQTRTYIYGQSSNVLVLDSPFPETRLILTNNLRTEGSYSNLFTLSASNEFFVIQRDDVVLARFDADPDTKLPNFVVPDGVIVADRFISTASRTPLGLDEDGEEVCGARKAFVIEDFNQDALHQFVGFGYNAGILNYQVPIANAQHIFYAGFDAECSLEIMRIGLKDDLTQVGIGTTSVRDGVALEVAGGVHVSQDLTVEGNLRVTGALDFSLIQGVPTLDPVTQKLATNVLPDKVLFLDEDNLINAHYLPTLYNGPYIRGSRNVGIGLRNPVQKLHVIGSTVTSDRLGIGTAFPVARLHVYDCNISAPSVRIDKPRGDGDDALIVYGPDDQVAFNVSANGAVGIGVYNSDAEFPLRVAGGIRIDGAISLENINVDNFNWKNRDTNTTYMSGAEVTLDDGTFEPVIQAFLPFQATQRIITPEIRYGGAPADPVAAEPKVLFKSSGIRVQGDSVFESHLLSSNLHVTGQAVFETPALTLSDARIKCNLKRVQSPLSALDKIHGYTYTYAKSLAAGASGGGAPSAGLLAQEVERGFPTAVSQLADGRLAVQYDSVLALLIEGFHELKQTVKALETKLDRLH